MISDSEFRRIETSIEAAVGRGLAPLAKEISDLKVAVATLPCGEQQIQVDNIERDVGRLEDGHSHLRSRIEDVEVAVNEHRTTEDTKQKVKQGALNFANFIIIAVSSILSSLGTGLVLWALIRGV